MTTTPDPRELAEHIIRDHLARIDEGCVSVHIAHTHPRIGQAEFAALRKQVKDLIGNAADFTLTFEGEGK